MEANTVKNYFENPLVVADYLRAAEEVGLWESERIVVEKYVPKTATILELGCGAGRIARGLSAIGYQNITATDFSENMVLAASELAKKYNDNTVCKVCDATKICFAPESFDAVVFGFNGLMQIPKEKNRIKAMREIYRVLKPNGVFIFTTHDRKSKGNEAYWSMESKQWIHGCQNPVLDEYGDIFYKGDHGNIFIHSPVDEEIKDNLNQVGFEILFQAMRSDIAQENALVEDFSDECVFRVVKKS
ncbi:MAG: class I SAM-dependent methyltransferase [Verrucomicrobiaceae bacterium]|nr:class I SAM-dependent methyltransferase [Verrucomicrobiaceae bacterium]